jgi:hypothetical protein
MSASESKRAYTQNIEKIDAVSRSKYDHKIDCSVYVVEDEKVVFLTCRSHVIPATVVGQGIEGA